MRRLAFALAVLSAGALTACSGGGSVLNLSGSNTPGAVIVTVGGPSNIARVIPGASLALSAQAVSGSQNGTLSNNRFTWSAALTTGGTYVANTSGQTKACASVNLTESGVTVPLTADFNLAPYSTLVVDLTNSQNVSFVPPTVIAIPAGATAGATVATNYPYCVTVSATALDGNGNPTGVAGSISVAVVNPANPEQ
jgi:hypothetical protein